MAARIYASRMEVVSSIINLMALSTLTTGDQLNVDQDWVWLDQIWDKQTGHQVTSEKHDSCQRRIHFIIAE